MQVPYCHLPQPEMNPSAFNTCIDARSANLYGYINDAICSDRMPTERKQLSKLQKMVIIYIMVYSQSQRSNSFQVKPSNNSVSLNGDFELAKTFAEGMPD